MPPERNARCFTAHTETFVELMAYRIRPFTNHSFLPHPPSGAGVIRSPRRARPSPPYLRTGPPAPRSRGPDAVDMVPARLTSLKFPQRTRQSPIPTSQQREHRTPEVMEIVDESEYDEDADMSEEEVNDDGESSTGGADSSASSCSDSLEDPTIQTETRKSPEPEAPTNFAEPTRKPAPLSAPGGTRQALRDGDLIRKPVGEAGRPNRGGYTLEAVLEWDKRLFVDVRVCTSFTPCFSFYVLTLAHHRM